MKITEQGLVNRGEPGTRSAVLTFPAFVRLSDGPLLATWRAGSTKDGEDERIELSRSRDLGATWEPPWTPFQAPRVQGRGGSLKICYLTEVAPARLVAAFMWVDRES